MALAQEHRIRTASSNRAMHCTPSRSGRQRALVSIHWHIWTRTTSHLPPAAPSLSRAGPPARPHTHARARWPPARPRQEEPNQYSRKERKRGRAGRATQLVRVPLDRLAPSCSSREMRCGRPGCGVRVPPCGASHRARRRWGLHVRTRSSSQSDSSCASPSRVPCPFLHTRTRI